MGGDHQEHYSRNEFYGMTDRELDLAITRKQALYGSLSKTLPDKGEKLLKTLKGLEAEREHRKRVPKAGNMSLSNGFGSYIRNEFSSMTDRELDNAISRKQGLYGSLSKTLPDKGEKLLKTLKGLKAERERRKRVQKEISMTGFPLSDSQKKGRLAPRGISKTLEEQKIDSAGTKDPSKGSRVRTRSQAFAADDNNDDSDFAMGEKPDDKDEEDSSDQITSFPQLSQVVEEMQISVTMMQSQVDKLTEKVDKLSKQNSVDELTEQVGGFAQCLKAYDDHFAAIRRQLDCYFPCPPRPPQ